MLTDGLARFPDNAEMHYSVACWESLAGNQDAAIAALTTAFELDPKSAACAKTETDLDAIRGQPGSPV